MDSNCPICNSANYKIIGLAKTNEISKNFINEDHYVVQCNNCELYFTAPRISFSSSQWSYLYNNEYFSSQSSWLINKRSKELSDRFDKALINLPDNNVKFLDIGAGEGKALIEALRRGWEVTGIDIVDNRIKKAKQEDVNFIIANFLEYELPENYFDFIYVDSVLEHVLNPKEYLIKIKQLLKPGGIVYIGVPNEDSLFNVVRKIVFTLIGKKNISAKTKPFDAPYHVIGFNKKSLSYIFNKLNMKIVNMKNIGRKFDFLSHLPNQRGFWISLIFLFPIEFIGKILNRDVYYAVYLSKRPDKKI